MPLIDGDDVDSDADPAYLLLERESAANAAAQYVALWKYATKAQRHLLTAWLAQVAVGGSLADAARAAGMAEGTTYAQLSHLRATLRNRAHTN